MSGRYSECPECGGRKPRYMKCLDCGYSHLKSAVYSTPSNLTPSETKATIDQTQRKSSASNHDISNKPIKRKKKKKAPPLSKQEKLKRKQRQQIQNYLQNNPVNDSHTGKFGKPRAHPSKGTMNSGQWDVEKNRE